MGISVIILVRLNEILMQSGKTVFLPEGVSGILETFDNKGGCCREQRFSVT